MTSTQDVKRQAVLKGQAARDAMAKAVGEAVLEHKAAGNPLPTWRDGRVVMVPPEEILAPDGD